HRNAQHRVRRLSPFHLLDDVGVGLPDETSDASERLAAPILQLLDSRINQRRGRVSSYSLRAALSLVHGCCLSLRRWYLLVEEPAPYIAAPRVQCCTERPRRIFLVVPARGRLVSEKFDIRRDPCYADAHKCDFRPMSTRSILRADRLKRLFEPDPADFGKDQDRLRGVSLLIEGAVIGPEGSLDPGQLLLPVHAFHFQRFSRR